MLRAIKLLPAHERRGAGAVDTVILTSEQRRAAKGEVIGIRGTRVLLDLPHAPSMRTDDALVLEDGRLVEVVAAVEPLCEARADGAAALAQLAWALGDRHVPVEVLPNRLRVRRTPEIEKLLSDLGAKVALIEAPFEPEGGAYAAGHGHGGHEHGHDHEHHHGHGHDHGDRHRRSRE